MEIETSSTDFIGNIGVDKISTMTALLRLNCAIFIISLVLCFMITIPIILRYERSSSLTISDGKLSLNFEQFITQEHPFRNPFLNSWAALDFTLLHTGKPGVLIGNDGWLFTQEEFPLHSAQGKLMHENLEHLQATVASLHAKGIETVILPVPAKAEIYRQYVPEKLRTRILPEKAITDYLSAHHIAWIPLKDAMEKAGLQGKQTFFRTETHWTPEGAHIAALQTASWLKTHRKIIWSKKNFTVIANQSLKLNSDLENFIPVKPYFSNLLLPEETYIPYKTLNTVLSNDATALFGDDNRSVALVGTSYSADDRWNFAGWLRKELHTDIKNVSEKGKGPFFPMENFMRLHSTGASQSHLVIWEIPVRSMFVDYAAMEKNKPG